VKKSVAWGLVVAQFAFLIGLVAAPAGTLWSRTAVVWGVAGFLVLVGAVIGIAAGGRLGKNLTPNPIPRDEGTLETGGLYRWVRHPIYSAVIAIALGLSTLGASWLHLVIFLSLVMLIGIKARAEERLLLERFPDYQKYQARVGRFFPGIGRIPLGR
jgi:protein-S-isoprenylcysteine O-methyltransferase Ste14